MARLLVGLPALQGDLEKYKARFDLLELRPIDTSLPKIGTLRKWRKAVPPAFVFSVVLPRAVGQLAAGKELDAALESSLEIASAVEARCVVLQTPASVRPTAANRRRIAALFARIPPEGTVRCWEPGGMWEREDVLATAREAGALAVFDAAREALPPGPIAYTRLRALGKSIGLGAVIIERVADRLRKRREAFVVVEQAGEGQRVRAALGAAIGRQRERPQTSTVVRPMQPSPLIAEDEEQ
jgi:uncharacterized protein YecE (DUF72 family)